MSDRRVHRTLKCIFTSSSPVLIESECRPTMTANQPTDHVTIKVVLLGETHTCKGITSKCASSDTEWCNQPWQYWLRMKYECVVRWDRIGHCDVVVTCRTESRYERSDKYAARFSLGVRLRLLYVFLVCSAGLLKEMPCAELERTPVCETTKKGASSVRGELQSIDADCVHRLGWPLWLGSACTYLLMDRNMILGR